MLMLNPSRTLAAAAALISLAAAAQTPPAAAPRANDFPTLERVNYVQECMREHPGPSFEMTAKCACAVDRLAEQISYDEYSALSTDAKATTIAGERGGVLRENEGVQKEVRRYRDLQAKAKKACFIEAK